ncbi:MAG: hypothetical protein JW795_01980 [Chitinivibrionales bacterium]|nr:hypothetical protein [Chitinivibrionales bacterium]
MALSGYIQAFGALHASGIYSSSRGFIPWLQKESGCSPVQLSFCRQQVYSLPYHGFGKLAPHEKIAFGATALSLEHILEYTPEKTGISMAQAFGSLLSDLSYCESVASGFASPALFPATLPSCALAEIALLFKLKGPNRLFTGLNCSGYASLEAALCVIQMRTAAAMVVSIVTAQSNDLNTISAYAFFLTQTPCNSGLNRRIDCLDQPNQLVVADTIPIFDSEDAFFLALIHALSLPSTTSFSCSTSWINQTITIGCQDTATAPMTDSR